MAKYDTTNLNVRVNSTLKEDADLLFNSLGLNMSTAVNMFLTKCVKTSSIPFRVEEAKPSRKLKKALKEADKMMKHPERYKSYDNAEEMVKDILNED